MKRRSSKEINENPRKRQKTETVCHGAMVKFLALGGWTFQFDMATWKPAECLSKPPPTISIPNTKTTSMMTRLLVEVVSLADATFISMLGIRDILSIQMVSRATYHAFVGCEAYWFRCISAYADIHIGTNEHAALAAIDPTISSFRAMRRRMPRPNVLISSWKQTEPKDEFGHHIVVHQALKIVYETLTNGKISWGRVCMECYEKIPSVGMNVVEKRRVVPVRFIARMVSIPDVFIVRLTKRIESHCVSIDGKKQLRGDVALIAVSGVYAGYIGILPMQYGTSCDNAERGGVEEVLKNFKFMAGHSHCPLCTRVIKFC
jgi:hypothetical protein